MPPTEQVGRSHELAAAVSALRTDPASIVTVSGGAGIGKSRLLDSLANALTDDGRCVVRLIGSAATAALPLGVWSPWISALGAGVEPSAHRVAGVIRAAALDEAVVVVADDADQLDDGSAALLHQLTFTMPVGVVLAQRRPPLAGEPMAALWSDPAALRLELGPLDAEHVVAIASAVVGGPLEPVSAAQLVRLADGNALHAREIALAALDAGRVETGPGGEIAIELPAGRSRLWDLLSRRLGEAGQRLRSVLVQVALGEPLGPGELDGTTDELVELEALGLIRSGVDGRRVVIRLAHPLHGEILRRESTPLERREAFGRLAGALGRANTSRTHDPVRLATWSIEGGLDVDVEVLAAATTAARVSTDLDLAERLATEAFARMPSFLTGYVLAEILADVADAETAEAHNRVWAHHASAPDELAVVAMVGAMVAYWRRRDRESSQALFAEATMHAASAPIRELVDALGAALDAMSGDYLAAARLAGSIGSIESPAALMAAAAAVGHHYQRLGRSLTALSVFDDVLAALDRSGALATTGSPALRHGVELGRLAVLVHAGRLDEADDVVDRMVASQRLTAELTADFGGALNRWHQGRFAEAAAMYGAAETLARRGHLFGNPRWMIAGRALCLAQLGDAAEARAALDALAAAGPHPVRSFSGLVWAAYAWTAHAEGDPAAARRFLEDGVADCRSYGDVDGEIRCLHDLARIGEPGRAVELLDETPPAVIDEFEGELLPAMVRAIRALAADDADALVDVADRFERMGTLLWAAEAAAAASAALARRGDRRQSTAWVKRSDDLRRRCDAAATPTMAGIGALVPLTRREREVVVLAARGLTSRVIGERLFVSGRTVESHLARAYAKLGVSTRAELAKALGDTLYES